MASSSFRCSAALLLIISVLSITGGIVDAKSYSKGLKDDFYRYSCPEAESVIAKVANDNFTAQQLNLRFASSILRLSFHDCFVQGCDGSVLLDGPNTEKTAVVNEFLTGFEIIEKAKAKLEEICPGVVSCADILQYAARDAVVVLNGSSWKVQGGRKDGLTSKAERAEADLPSPNLGLDGLVASFRRRGLTREQMVILSGSHTAGVGHCTTLIKRLYNWSKKNPTDPSIPPQYAAELKASCPEFTFNKTIILFMDVITPFFDSNYYVTLQQHKGLFHSDQVLFNDHRTRSLVKSLTDNGKFLSEFGEAMRAMAAVGVKKGGQIRKVCGKVNEYLW